MASFCLQAFCCVSTGFKLVAHVCAECAKCTAKYITIYKSLLQVCLSCSAAIGGRQWATYFSALTPLLSKPLLCQIICFNY